MHEGATFATLMSRANMGASKKRKEEFFKDHPNCFFCGEGLTPTTWTIDHVPARECFKDRVGPEGFKFPACKRCNGRHRRIEQVAALYIRVFDLSAEPESFTQIDKLVSGVRNNDPQHMFYLLKAYEKRRALRAGRLSVDRTTTFADMPIVGFPQAGHEALEQFGRKLTCALFYKHCGKPMPLEYCIKTQHIFYSESRSQEVASRFSKMLPDYQLSQRVNTDIGEQFHYRFGVKDDGSIFGYIAQFAKSLFIIGAASAPNERLMQHWKQHASDLVDTEATPEDVGAGEGREAV
jgi:hypothetical protein